LRSRHDAGHETILQCNRKRSTHAYKAHWRWKFKRLYNDWVEKHLPEYKGFPIFECSDEMKEYLFKHRTDNSDGDGSTCLTEYVINKKKDDNDE